MTHKIVTIGSEQHEVDVERDGSLFRGGERSIEIVSMGVDELEARIEGRVYFIPFAVQGSTVSFAWKGEIWFADVVDKGSRARVRHRDHSMAAPMPGVVLKILASAGDVVEKGAALLILEAMKMEHQIVAPRHGTVMSVNCREGELVQPGEDLVTMSDDSQPEAVEETES